MSTVQMSTTSVTLDPTQGLDRLECDKSTAGFPEGGTQAWMVVLGAFCVSFSTFGYMNAFGYTLVPAKIPLGTSG